MAELVTKVKGLKSPKFDHMVYQGIQEDFDQLERAFYQHLSLIEFNVGNMRSPTLK